MRISRLGGAVLVLAMVISAGACDRPTAGRAPVAVQPVRIATAKTSAWRSVELPTPQGVTITAPVGGFSCGSPGNCVVAGQAYQGFSTTGSAFTVSEANGRWGQPRLLTMPIAVQSSQANAVSCAPDGSCLVVGQAYSDHANAFVIGEYHGHWSPVTVLPTPPGLAFVGLTGVACVSYGNCVAVGSSRPRQHQHHPGAGHGISRDLAGRQGRAAERAANGQLARCADLGRVQPAG
jgi:hypothetical protein